MGSMVRARRKIEKERLVGRDLLEVRNETDRLVRKVRGEVITLLRGFRRFDLMVVVDEIG